MTDDRPRAGPEMLAGYLETLALVERLHRLMLDVIKDEFERLGIIEINAVQALLLFNVGDHEVTAGELKSRGFYQGSNVSYNLKKLVQTGFLHHHRSEQDRRTVRIRLTSKGQRLHDTMRDLFFRHAEGVMATQVADEAQLAMLNTRLHGLERYWMEQIRYIY
ncbi:MarR family transcriptional regulator [Rhodobacteraceae bacterium]|nr:MarR family transcriptional regulator [Paracoccaceae bacterium]